jgi:predicted ATPase/class 3 adenylate cyclase
MVDNLVAPTGTVTFLFTDIEGSTRLWQDEPELMRAALVEHDSVLRDVIAKRHGFVFKHTGDGVAAAFASARDAVDAAVDAQQRLDGLPFRVRIAIHTGEADLRDGDYFGPSVNRCARLMAIGHGGQILLSAATSALVRDRLDLVNLGEHRLRDVAVPEHVCQVGASAFPPLRSLGRFPGNLPSQLTSFRGRTDEVARLADALRHRRIVTLTGVGGVGKTRLAVQVGLDVESRFEHGAWLIELAAVRDADVLPYAMASTLGVRPRPLASVLESIRLHLSDRRVLLVFDNCEHLLDPAGRVVEDLTRSCPGVVVLATSREALAIAGEQVWPVRSLPVATDSVDLFADRARDANPDFEIDDPDAVAEICRRLDGIPLAIELAAARTVSLSSRDIAERVDERFRLLTGGRRTAVERHQTLRAAVDWSYDLLDPPEQRVFEEAAVFAGGFSLDAAAAVMANEQLQPYEVLDSITSLVNKSMIVAEPSADGSRRYRLLETMRQYGQDRFDQAGLGDALRARHARYFADFSGRAARGWRSLDEQVWRHRLALEIDNLRAAVGCAVAHNETDLAVRLVGPLSDQAEFYPSWGLAALAESVLGLPDAERHPLAVGLLATATREWFRRGDPAQVRATADRAIAMASEPGRVVWPRVWAYAATARHALGDFDDVAALMSKGVEVAKALGDPFDIAFVAATAAAVVADDATVARSYADLATTAISGVCGPEMGNWVAGLCGMAYFESDPGRAIKQFEDTITLNASVTDGNASVHLEFVLGYLAVLYADQRKERAALRTARQGVEVSRDLSDLMALATTLEYVGVTLSILGYHEPASLLYAVNDAGIVAFFRTGTTGWRNAVRNRGRALTLAALGPQAMDHHRASVAAMTVPDVTSFALAEIDAILERTSDVPPSAA